MVDTESNLKGKALEQENQQNNSITHISLNEFVRDNKLMAYSVILLFFIVLSFAGYLIFNERFSEKSKLVSEVNNNLLKGVKESTESIESIPKIVASFSEMVKEQVSSSLLLERDKVEKEVDKKLENVTNKIEKLQEDLLMSKEALDKVLYTIKKINEDAKQENLKLEKQKNELRVLFPNIEKYKDIVNPVILISKLKNSNWEDGVSVLEQIRILIEKSSKSALTFPAKYIEVTGDWCREMNQYQLAEEYYQKAINRDPERISAKVELYTLQMEYSVNLRGKSLEKLKKLALETKLPSD